MPRRIALVGASVSGRWLLEARVTARRCPFPLPVLLAALVVAGRQGQAQQRVIRDSEAASYVGQTFTVEGTIVSVGTSRRSATVFLNFGAAYPNQTFTAVIFRSAASRFPNPEQWEGKRVRVTGQVRLYRGKPEIILNDASQLLAAP